MLAFTTLLLAAAQLFTLTSAYGSRRTHGPETLARRLNDQAQENSRRKLPMDMRGLRRLANETLAGRSVFPTSGIRGVNIGSWFVFGE